MSFLPRRKPLVVFFAHDIAAWKWGFAKEPREHRTRLFMTKFVLASAAGSFAGLQQLF